jgi:hypothetical protein
MEFILDHQDGGILTMNEYGHRQRTSHVSSNKPTYGCRLAPRVIAMPSQGALLNFYYRNM